MLFMPHVSLLRITFYHLMEVRKKTLENRWIDDDDDDDYA